MDCMMPEMDGYAATRHIREHEGHRHTPIVAMTANAMEGDRELCLASGMDDYIAKPVELHTLRDALERAPSRKPSRAEQPTGATRGPVETAGSNKTHEPLDRTVLINIRRLQQEGQPDVLRMLFDLFVEDTPRRLAAIRGAVQSRNAALMARQAHALKGSSAHLGARYMASLSAILEQLGEAGSLQTAASTLSQLETEFERVTRAFEAELGET
jgi:HPt (histidine-containing phosphotransfer) domain-containing protein